MNYIGIDLGGTNIAAGIVREDGTILHKCSVKTGAERSEDELIAHLAETARELMRRAEVSPEEIRSVGVGSPGSVDPDSGTVLSASNLNFKNTALGPRLSALLGMRVQVENDANCAAWAEAKAGAAAGCRHMIMITLGTGVGGGIVINGSLYGGFNHFGGEFGHAVICADGELCNCGDRGCFEAYSSATALIRDTRRAAARNTDSLLWQVCRDEGKFSGRTAFTAARMGDATAQQVVDRYVHYLAVGVGSLIRIFQPEVLVIGGGIANEGDGLFVPLRRRVAEMSHGNSVPKEMKTRILPALLGNDAGIVGAALLGKQK